MLSRRFASAAATLVLAASPSLLAQTERHGRKYKAPPETSHLEILVVKDANGKVIENAGVIFHPMKDGIDEGNLEVKSGPDGKAFIDIIPTGSDVQVQVIASGFVTHAENMKLDTASRQITVRMKRPTQQVSAYDEAEGKGTLGRRIGVQEPIHNAVSTTGQPKPLAASEPIIKLPALPKSKGADGDATIQPSHNVTPPPEAPKPLPNKGSSTTGPVNGTAGSSPSTN